MSKKTHLYVLWTNGDPITAEKMVFMYTINSLIHGRWEKVTLIIRSEGVEKNQRGAFAPFLIFLYNSPDKGTGISRGPDAVFY